MAQFGTDSHFRDCKAERRKFGLEVTAEGSIFSARAIFKKMATATLQTFQRGEYVVEPTPEPNQFLLVALCGSRLFRRGRGPSH